MGSRVVTRPRSRSQAEPPNADRMPDVLPAFESRRVEDDDGLAKADASTSRRSSIRRKSATDMDAANIRKEENADESTDYAHETGAWRLRVRGLMEQIYAHPSSFFLFKRVKNEEMPELEDQLFCIAVKFTDQDRLLAEEDLQLRSLYILWKEFKNAVVAMEKRLMQCLETEDVAVDDDSCTDDTAESSGDEEDSGDDASDSESHVQRASDYAREAVEFRGRVDQLMEEISDQPPSSSTEVSLRMITHIKQVDLPALAASLGRLLNMQAECEDDQLQWRVLKREWTRLRDAVDERENELKELNKNDHTTAPNIRSQQELEKRLKDMEEQAFGDSPEPVNIEAPMARSPAVIRISSHSSENEDESEPEQQDWRL